MPAAKEAPWTTLALSPLTGVLDLRSRPAEVPQGGFRYKLNIATSVEGKLCRRQGFTSAFADYLYDSDGMPLTDPDHTGTGVFRHNHDHHHQGADREPISFLYEHTTSDGLRILFDGTQSRLSRLDQNTGYWTDLLTGVGSYAARWRAASLQDYVLFANGVNAIYQHPVGPGTTSTIPELVALGISAAKVIVEFQGIILIMNVTVAGIRKATSIYWSDLNGPISWNPATVDTLAGKQDLPYGDEILAAAPMLNALYIYTRRGIWRCTVSGQAEKTFDFYRVYSEPRNQTGCLAYPFTLISTGTDHYYASRDDIYHYNPYLAVPEANGPEMDWMHLATGAIFSRPESRTNGVQCNAPTAEYVPATREMWFSWPSGNRTVNNWTLVAQMKDHTADVVDEGFSAMANFRRTPVSGAICNENQSFLIASTKDYCIKESGGVFFREHVVMGDSVVNDIALDAAEYTSDGYYTELRGMVPTGLFDRDKVIRKLLLDTNDADEDVPNVIRAWIGNSQSLADPIDPSDVCTVLWNMLGIKTLSCQNLKTISKLKAQGLRAANDKDFPTYQQGRFLYFRIRIEAPDGSEPVGGDSCFSRIEFDVLPLTKIS